MRAGVANEGGGIGPAQWQEMAELGLVPEPPSASMGAGGHQSSGGGKGRSRPRTGSLDAQAQAWTPSTPPMPPQPGPKVMYGNARRWHSGTGAGAGTALEKTASLPLEHARKLQMAMHARKQQQQANGARQHVH